MRGEQARIGARVRVGESALRPEWRGLTGTIGARWGHPEYPALDVRMEDGRSRLFWHHELERVPEGEPAASGEKAGA
ncbi:MAG: hypothetical protein M3N18_07015 [Actinomycetota bacterium]|nr:hypothetical protein [Actinomycetota bacterium]